MEDICTGCAPMYLELASEKLKNNEGRIEFFSNNGVLPKELKCTNCCITCKYIKAA